MPALNALKTFEAAARLGSFARAAQDLHVTHGAVSKQIRALEEELGEPLFERRNRAVFLTERGRELAASLSAVFADFHNAIADFRGRRADQPLVISCEPTLCLKFLIPRLSDLKDRTGLEVRVLAAGGHVDFRRDHVDLAIRRNDFAISPGVYTKSLAPEAMGLVCSEAVAADLRAGPKRRYPALHTRSRPTAWTEWKMARRPTAMPKLAGAVVYEHFYLAIEAALAGQGVALASIHMVKADIGAGRIHALTEFVPDGTSYIALSPRDFDEDARLVVFCSWMSAGLTEPLFGASA